MMTGVIFLIFFICLMIAIPISISLGIVSILPGILDSSFTVSAKYIVRSMFGGLDSFPLLAVPMFIFSGILMARGGISKRLFNVFSYFLGKFTAGIPCAVIVTCLFYGAISGSAPATVAAVGSMTIPFLCELGYDKKFATAIVAVAGGLGVIIPPSIPFIMYGTTTGESVSDLFMAGIIPGVIIAALLMIYSIVYCNKYGEDREKIVIELNELHEEIDRISNSTQFNEKDLLNGQTVIRIEKQYTITKGAAMNDQISKIQVQKGFDFSDLDLGGLGFVSHKQGEISFEPGKNINYKVSVDNMVNQKVQPGATITINDSDGKYIKFAVKQEIDLNIATQVKMINVALKEKEIKGKEIKLQIGANTDSSQTLKVKIDNMSTESLEISKDDISNMKKEGSKGTEAATKMIDNLDDALERVNVSRGNLGAMQNRLQTASSNLNTMNENLTSIESRIRDVDVAEEMMNLSKLNLINQAAQAMMSQAKSQPEGVMQLLR